MPSSLVCREACDEGSERTKKIARSGFDTIECKYKTSDSSRRQTLEVSPGKKVAALAVAVVGDVRFGGGGSNERTFLLLSIRLREENRIPRLFGTAPAGSLFPLLRLAPFVLTVAATTFSLTSLAASYSFLFPVLCFTITYLDSYTVSISSVSFARPRTNELASGLSGAPIEPRIQKP